MMGILQGQVAGSGIWRPAGRWFLNNIELILTAVGIGVILLSGFVASRSAFSLETATAVSATLVGVVHGILFWLLRRRQRWVRQEAIRQIREMLEDLGKNRLQTIKMSLYMVQARQPEQEERTRQSFDRVYQILAEMSTLIDHISEESLAGWRHRYRQTLQRVESESQ
ncbi:MAG: hypothetical protein RRA39_08160 [Cyanobacteriota bacterium PSP.bin.10]|jgi:uncharacterized membrane protein (Fun14 family)|nr:hypothetical protein [Cyanobacteriota bacterium PSP.bin.10]